MTEIALDTGKYCFGINEIMDCLEEGVVKDLIVYENLDLFKVQLYDKKNKIEKEEYMKETEKENSLLEIKKDEAFVDYISEVYQNFGCKLHMISDRTAIGNQIINGFGGLCGILRWKRNIIKYEENNNQVDEDFDIEGYEYYEDDFL